MRDHPSRKSGFVYFLQAETGGPVKIGYTTDLEKRLASMQAVNPTRLCYLAVYEGTAADEYDLHVAFKGDRLHGEWFALTDELLRVIRGEREFRRPVPPPPIVRVRTVPPLKVAPEKPKEPEPPDFWVSPKRSDETPRPADIPVTRKLGEFRAQIEDYWQQGLTLEEIRYVMGRTDVRRWAKEIGKMVELGYFQGKERPLLNEAPVRGRDINKQRWRNAS